ncbi:hypothetical protein [Halopelagius longus]|uniref:Uncharacterized protein n=1 Tax=Halopelagius longus TaxID=1236180 RepID=A0A1H1DRB1_9EURY|nr:hypothetical protein [Halopelagius longus]SDQ79035.1 hypothetical protein SAMN05216278_2544 [Halopelagius longus]
MARDRTYGWPECRERVVDGCVELYDADDENAWIRSDAAVRLLAYR